MNILLIFPGFIIALIIVIYYERKMKNVINESYKNKNKVRFYVARDKSGYLYLHIGKPFRDRLEFSNNSNIYYQLRGNSFKRFGLNENDYANLKWEDEPVEVFVNMDEKL